MLVSYKGKFSQWLPGLALLLIACAVYLPAFHAGFIWDDELLLTENPLVKAPDGLRFIWFSNQAPDYFPLTFTSFWLEWRLWGMNPTGYHLVNVCLHALGSLLLWRVLCRLAVPGAWLAAILFAVHPVGAASVMWIAERKNTLSLVFFFLAVLWYLRFDATASAQPPSARPAGATGKPQLRWYWLSLGAYMLALFSKTSVVMLPLILLGCIWWRYRRITLRDIYRTIPFFALSLILGLITVWFQTHRALEGIGPTKESILVRLLGGSWGIWFYLYKAALPINLSAIYPFWPINPQLVLTWLPGLLWLATLLTCCFFRKQWGRPLLFGLGYFWLTLLPVLGFFNMSYLMHSRVADHWQYLSLPAITALAAALLCRNAPPKKPSNPITWRCAVSAALVILLAIATWSRAALYPHPENLWSDALRKNPNAWAAHNNLGRLLGESGHLPEAEFHYKEAVRLKPDSPLTHFNLGNAFFNQGKYPAAAAQFTESLQLLPDYGQAHANLANSLVRLGKPEEALRHFAEAIRLDPDNANDTFQWANLLEQLGKKDEAILHYQDALRLDPTLFAAHNNLGRILGGRGKLEEARTHFLAAIQLNPAFPEAHAHLGKLLAAENKLAEAVVQYTEALRLDPENPVVHQELADVLIKQGRSSEAIPHQVAAQLASANLLARQGNALEAKKHYLNVLEFQPDNYNVHSQLAELLFGLHDVGGAIAHWREATRLQPDSIRACNNLAWVLSTQPDAGHRNAAEALQLAEHVCKLTDFKQPALLDTLAAAYAESGRFDDAVKTIQKAIQQANVANQNESAKNLGERLKLYQAGKPWRDR